jgi:3-hydroxyisobutyrate dehydrogenase-like beta-hydroxyacid dehydrogenase
MSHAANGQAISVIGLGAMGTALAKAFLANGHRVTVWNRSAQKTTPLVEAGAVAAPSVAEAIDASPIIVICVIDYAASNSLLHGADISRRFRGKTVVQLTSAKPTDAREGGEWAKRCGANYLEGAIWGYPRNVGTPDGTVLYSGSRVVFEATQPVLLSLGNNALFVGENIATAAALDLSLVASYELGTMVAFLHGAAMCEAVDVPLDTYLSMALDVIHPALSVPTMQMSVEMIKKGSYAGSEAAIATWQAGVEQAVRATNDIGVDSTFLEGLLGYLKRASAAGHAQDELPAVFECFRRRATRV